MKNKTITYILVTVILVYFISYFGVKEMVSKHIDLTDSIVQVEYYAKKGKWQKAHSHAIQVNEKWKKYSLLINMNYGESEHALFDESLNSLVAGSEAKDLPTVLVNAKNAKRFWKNVNKIVPGP